MKKLLSGFFAALMACAVIGCGDTGSDAPAAPATPAPEADADAGDDAEMAETDAEEEAAE